MERGERPMVGEGSQQGHAIPPSGETRSRVDKPTGQDSGGEAAVRRGLGRLAPSFVAGRPRELRTRRCFQRLLIERMSAMRRLGAGPLWSGMEEWRLEVEPDTRGCRPSALRARWREREEGVEEAC